MKNAKNALNALIIALLFFSLLAFGCTQQKPVTPSPTPQASVSPTTIPIQTGSADTKAALIAEFVKSYVLNDSAYDAT